MQKIEYYAPGDKQKVTLSMLTVPVFISLVLMSSISNVNLAAIDAIGTFFLLCLLTISNLLVLFFFLKERMLPIVYANMIFFGLCFTLIGFIGLYNHANARSFITLYQFVSVMNFTLYMSSFKWDFYKLKGISNLSMIYILCTVFIWAASGFPIPFSSIFSNANILAPYLLYLLFFPICMILYKKQNIMLYLILVSGVLLCVATSARTILLSLLSIVLTYLLWHSITRSKTIFYSFFFFIIMIILAVTFIYPNLSEWDHYRDLERLVWEYTGKNIFSGREVVWSHLISLISQQPFFGYGTGTLVSDISNKTISAHNLYLQISLQGGYIGLSVFILLLFSIWKIFWYGQEDRIVRLSAAYLIATLIHQLFEVSFIQNQLSIGLLQWLIIAVGISRIYNKIEHGESFIEQKK
ncbi:O-antigen ligase family protein [Bacillus benzoevorans]|uniref:O-antigen ligase n=1 Tax=Bacillus benzoevorans TaxID=1456 RepID=A0A7X0HU02_9BACI|nr:O-antigen ligase family protein [Bacillus benzoevorans]MBB6446842.1 O-antigen ligase [Bacillus benzoevorans]